MVSLLYSGHGKLKPCRYIWYQTNVSANQEADGTVHGDDFKPSLPFTAMSAVVSCLKVELDPSLDISR